MAAETLLRAFDAELRLAADSDSFVWTEKLGALSSARLRHVGTIVLGDSQAMSGILPAELGPDAYNLAMPSMQSEGLLALASALERLPRLRRIIVNISPFSLFESEVTSAFQTYARAELLPRFPALLFQSPGLKAGTAGGRLDLVLSLSATYRAHTYGSLFASFEQRLPGVPLSVLRKNPKLANQALVNTFLQSGWDPAGGARAAAARNLKTRLLLERSRGYWTWKDILPPSVARCAKVGARFDGAPLGGWQDFRKRAAAETAWRLLLVRLAGLGYEVHVVQIPFSAVWAAGTDAPSVYRRLDAFLARTLIAVPARLRGRLHVHGRSSTWKTDDAHLYHDWTHLSYCGAIDFTRRLRVEMGAAGIPRK